MYTFLLPVTVTALPQPRQFRNSAAEVLQLRKKNFVINTLAGIMEG
jgi:hypothetical protein